MVLALGESRNFRLLMSRYRSREVSQLPKNGGQLCLLLSQRFAFFVKPWFDTTASHEHNSRLIQIKRSISLFRCKVVEIFEKWMVPDTRHRALLWLLWLLACTFRKIHVSDTDTAFICRGSVVDPWAYQDDSPQDCVLMQWLWSLEFFTTEWRHEVVRFGRDATKAWEISTWSQKTFSNTPQFSRISWC